MFCEILRDRGLWPSLRPSSSPPCPALAALALRGSYLSPTDRRESFQSRLQLSSCSGYLGSTDPNEPRRHTPLLLVARLGRVDRGFPGCVHAPQPRPLGRLLNLRNAWTGFFVDPVTGPGRSTPEPPAFWHSHG